jgi:hypothetical protein
VTGRVEIVPIVESFRCGFDFAIAAKALDEGRYPAALVCQ